MSTRRAGALRWPWKGRNVRNDGGDGTANYNTQMLTERTFAVKDPEGFIKEIEVKGVHRADKTGYCDLCYVMENDGKFWLGGYDADLQTYNPETGEFEDIAPIIQKHMRKDEVAVFMGVGQEKLRSVSGYVRVVTPEEDLWEDLHSAAERLAKQAVDPGERLKRRVGKALTK